MGYRRALSFGWARRDTLAVVVIALTVSFLVGAAVLGVALGSQTTAIAAQFETPYGIDDTGRGDGAAVVELTVAETTLDGEQATVVGVPDGAPSITVRGRTVEFPPPDPGVLASADYQEAARQVSVGDRTVRVQPRESRPVLPDSWYVTDPETAAAFEGASAVTIRETETRPATPLLSALEFFVRGAAELVRLLQLATVAAGVLVAVTIYSVVQITVRERRPDIAVLRSTGATPFQIFRLFTVRALALTAVGTAAGYGFGLILVRAVVNAAVYRGLPTTLSARVTEPVLAVLLPAVVFFLLVGGLAGLLAAYRGATEDPASLTGQGRPDPGRLRERLGRLVGTRLVGWDALVPTAATLSVFMAALLLLTAVAGAVGPLADTGETITQPDAPHPIASSVPAAYADALRAQGATASPEILLFEVYDGNPIVARGVNFTAYRALSGVDVARGEAPDAENEALVGADLARSTGLSPGDTIVLGGSTDASVMRLELTGTFSGEGIQDDQLLVSLPAAREMSTTGDDAVQFVRTDGLDVDAAGTSTIVVTSARVVTENGTPGVAVDVTNLGLREATREVEVRLGERTRTTEVTVDSGRSARAFVAFEDLSDGTYPLVVGDVRKNVTVDGDSLVALDADGAGFVVEAPARAPVGGMPTVRVLRNGRPVGDATVSVDGRTATTNENGDARISLEAAGNVSVVAESEGRRARTTVTVAPDATRAPMLDVSVSPDAPSIFTRPEATVTARNPWEESVEANLSVTGPGVERTETLALDPGETVRFAVEISQRPAGAYDVTASGAGARASTTYTVSGDARLGAALAQSGQFSGGGGITQAIQVAFGNIEVLVLAVVSLLGVMTVGSTTAAFTRAVHTATREIGIRRATGADPRSVFLDVFVDALKIGTTAAVLSMALAYLVVRALLAVGELRVFGLVLEPALSPTIVLGALACGVALSLVSATLAAVAVLRRDPAALLVDRHIPTPSGSDE